MGFEPRLLSSLRSHASTTELSGFIRRPNAIYKLRMRNMHTKIDHFWSFQYAGTQKILWKFVLCLPHVTTKSDTYCTTKHLPHKNKLKISNEELLCPHLLVVFDDEKKVATIIISFISSSFIPSLISFSDCRFHYFTFSFQMKWK